MMVNSNKLYQKRISSRNTQQEDCNYTYTYTEHLCIHKIFEKQVERTPDAVAVVFEDEQLTYRQLNQEANQLAHYLQSLGVGPEVLVGICVERSLEMVVGLLGILKAGGAYVPLDPSYPGERLAFILEDTQTPVMLTTADLVNNLPTHQAQVVCLDSDWVNIARNSQANPVSEATIDNLIYVIYTSGSTGKPKGVMIPHRGICNQLYWRQTTFGLTASDKVLQTISFSFDPSVWQIFWPLCFGAQLVMARPGGQRDMSYLVEAIANQQITVAAFVPSQLRALLEQEGIENCRSLRHITSGGEALPIELVERFFERLNLDNVLVNCYGPTEASIDSTIWVCQRGTNYTHAPIGRPISNAEIYILDENLQPVADGDCGELYIGGTGLARGYFNRPDLTKERFIPHPFSSEPGARLYKTGDVGRYLPDSNIELLGRVDEQVKIRGFRIELGEIEAVLCQHPAVQETVVNLVVRSNANTREDVPGDKDLVAYVVLKPSQVATTEQLRLFLREKLPNYMIPSAFVMLDTLPLNLNGKVDRRALPAPEQVRQEATKTFVAARNQIEYQLTQIWEEVLGIQPIGIKDNFFDLGGHSFLALNLFARIEAQFGKKLPLAILFQSGSVEALADILQSQEQSATHTSEDWSSLVAIKPNGSKPPFFCIHPLGGETLCYRDLAMHLESDQPVYALQPQGLDGKRSPLTRIEDMASHYIQEIRTIQPNGPYFLGGYSFGGIVAFEMAQQLYKLGERVGMLAIFDTCLPGASMRLPFLKRIPLHVSNILRGDPAFLWQSLQMWTQQIKYDIKHKVYYELYGENPIFSAFQHVKIMDANIQAVTEYVLQVYPGNMILLRTEDKNRQKAVGVKYDLQFGWGNLVAGQLDVDFVPGSHTTMLEEPHVRVLAEKLQTCLDQALTENNWN